MRLLSNYQLILFGIIIILFGIFFNPLASVFSFFIFYLLSLKKSNYSSAFLIFYLILFLSDSRENQFEFIKSTKPIIATGSFLFLIYKGYKQRISPLIFQYLLPFIVFIILGSFFSSDKFTSLQKSISYSLLIYFVGSFIELVSNRYYAKFFHYLISAVITASVVSLALFYLGNESTNLLGRFRGFMGNPNGLGIWLVLMVFLIEITENRKITNYSKTFFLTFIGILIFSVLLSGSRTAIIALTIFYFIKFLPFKNKIFLGITLLGLGGTLVFLFQDLLISSVTNLGFGEVARTSTLETGSGRFIAWDFGWKKFLEQPLLGFGFGFTEVFFKQNYVLLSSLNHQGNAHNSYLTLLIDIGVIGLLLFLFGIFNFLRNFFDKTDLIWGIVFSVLFMVFFESWLTASLNPFTILFFIIISIPSKIETKK